MLIPAPTLNCTIDDQPIPPREPENPNPITPMSKKTYILILVSFFLLVFSTETSLSMAGSDKPAPKKNPRLSTLAPVGGQIGTSFDVTIRGEDLQGVRGAWFESKHLTAEINQIREITIERTRFSTKLQSPGQEIVIRVTALSEAAAGIHALRLLSEDGITDPLPLLITSAPITAEQNEPHHTAATSQLVSAPVDLCGQISQPAEMDYYSMEILEGQELQFEVLVTGGIVSGAAAPFSDPELILYNLDGSWFDSQRAVRVEARDESTFLPLGNKILMPRLKYHFKHAGRYAVRIGSRVRRGGPGYGYLLRIQSIDSDPSQPVGKWTDLQMAQGPSFEPWQERDFSRKLNMDRCRRLWSRTITEPDEPAQADGTSKNNSDQTNLPVRRENPHELETYAISRVLEQESLATDPQTLSLQSPVLIEGSIGIPGDIDDFCFEVKSGQSLAFEVETTHQMHPDFSPLMEITDSQRRSSYTNIHRAVEGNSAYWLKFLKSKMILTFEHSGTHFLRVRDLTARCGGPDVTYRLLIRPQVPHIGKVTVRGKDCINLLPGETESLTVVIDREEGFHHPVELFLTDLPSGTQSAAVVAEAESSPPVKNFRGEVNRDWFFPIQQKVTVTLAVDDDAQYMAEPCRARLMARAKLGDRCGKPFTVKDLWVMVVTPGRAE